MAAPAPTAIRLSMLGLLFLSVLKPFVKYFLLAATIGSNNKNCVNAKVIALLLP